MLASMLPIGYYMYYYYGTCNVLLVVRHLPFPSLDTLSVLLHPVIDQSTRSD